MDREENLPLLALGMLQGVEFLSLLPIQGWGTTQWLWQWDWCMRGDERAALAHHRGWGSTAVMDFDIFPMGEHG